MVNSTSILCLTLALVMTPLFAKYAPLTGNLSRKEMAQLQRDSFLIHSWIVDVLTSPPSTQGNTSSQKICDFSQNAWSLSAIRFRSTQAKLRLLASPEPDACTESRADDLLKLDIDLYSGKKRNIIANALYRESYVELPFRSDYAGSCTIYAGTFVRAGQGLYTVSQFSKNLQFLAQIPPASRFFLRFNFSPRKLYSLFMNITNHEDVPGYKSALGEASGLSSVPESTVQELSPSNTAILFLPVILSFIPVSLVSDEVSRTRVILFAIVTDFITNIPVIIKGGELLYISYLNLSAKRSATLMTRDSAIQMVEIWITKCSRNVHSRWNGVIFVSVGIWSCLVGFMTEYIAWRYVLEKKENENRELMRRSKPKFVTAEEVRLILVNCATTLQTGCIHRFRGKSRHSIKSATIQNEQSDRHPVPAEAESSAVETDEAHLSVNTDHESGAFAFFLSGAAFGFFLPFLALILLQVQTFKKTDQRKYFVFIGIMFGSLNAIAVFIHFFSDALYFNAFILFFDVVLILLLACSFSSRRKRTEVNGEQESGVLKFFYFGFCLGFITSLFSGLYLCCFPGLQGNEKRKRFLKYGCMTGALTNAVLVDYLFDFYFPETGFRLGIFIFLYNVFFILFLLFTEAAALNWRKAG